MHGSTALVGISMSAYKNQSHSPSSPHRVEVTWIGPMENNAEFHRFGQLNVVTEVLDWLL